jgi:hypothetical protein
MNCACASRTFICHLEGSRLKVPKVRTDRLRAWGLFTRSGFRMIPVRPDPDHAELHPSHPPTRTSAKELLCSALLFFPTDHEDKKHSRGNGNQSKADYRKNQHFCDSERPHSGWKRSPSLRRFETFLGPRHRIHRVGGGAALRDTCSPYVFDCGWVKSSPLCVQAGSVRRHERIAF